MANSRGTGVCGFELNEKSLKNMKQKTSSHAFLWIFHGGANTIQFQLKFKTKISVFERKINKFVFSLEELFGKNAICFFEVYV